MGFDRDYIPFNSPSGPGMFKTLGNITPFYTYRDMFLLVSDFFCLRWKDEDIDSGIEG